MRKTKIICTLGPATDKNNNLKNMILSGMNVARMNFSHADHDEHLGRIKKIKELRKELGVSVGLLLDTQGPEIRIKTFKNKTVNLIAGQKFTLTTRDLIGDDSIVSISYLGLPNDVSIGTSILIDDGLIELKVLEIKNKVDIICEVKNTATISDKKSVNIPGIKLNIPYMTSKDENDIIFGIKNGINFIAASFTRNQDDVQQILNILDKYNVSKKIDIIAKIENIEGVKNVKEILKKCSGIMVARGDLGVEVDYYKLPEIQKYLIKTAISLGKIVVTATQMLDSMFKNPRPTRAEVSDVANAIYDGTSAIMLSGETANGSYPVESVNAMSTIAIQIENNVDFDKRRITRNEFINLKSINLENSIYKSLALSTCNLSKEMNCKSIIIFDFNDTLIKLISSFRPSTNIIVFAKNQEDFIKASLIWGVCPVLFEKNIENFDIENVYIRETLFTFGLEQNDYVLIVNKNNDLECNLFIKKLQ